MSAIATLVLRIVDTICISNYLLKMFARGSVLYLLQVVLLSNHLAVGALPFHGMADNCILSFVVPKEKMKSSCELDEKVNRRINAIETKVNIYKQQVSDLLVQSDKQRQLHGDKMDKMEQQVKDISVNMDMSFLIERRIGLLEKEVQHLQSEVSSVKSTTGKLKPAVNDDMMSIFFNTVDKSFTLSNVAKSMIQSEMKVFLDNFTKRFEMYVQDQILMYHKLFSMVPQRNDIEITLSGRTSESAKSPHKGKDIAETRPEVPSMKTDKPDVKVDKLDPGLNYTEDQYIKAIISYLENTTIEEYNVSVTDENINITDDSLNNTSEIFNGTMKFSVNTPTNPLNSNDFDQTNNSEIFPSNKLFPSNDSFIGEASEANSSSTVYVVQSVEVKLSRSATSRMNSVSETGDDSKNLGDGDSEMISDQFHKQTITEVMIKEEISSMLSPRLAEVMSLLEKQKISLEETIKLQDKRCEQANEEISTQVKELGGNVHALSLQMESLSKGFKDSFSKLDKVKMLETLVNEVKNKSASGPLTMSALEVEEQSKKIKMLERLMNLYYQSLDQFKNETKKEYREMKESLENETKRIMQISTNLQNNLTSTFSSDISKQNSIFSNRIAEISQQLSDQDQALLLLQIDLVNIEKTVNSKSSRFSDRDVDKIQDEINQLVTKQRDFKKKLDHIEQKQVNLTDSLNTTNSEISAMKMEAKLAMDEWIPLSFEYDTTKTDCYGDQYVKRTKYSKSLLVGVVKCSPKRYKIFLSSSLHGKFLNIGDGHGLGEDHCEFVGGTNDTVVTLSPHKPSHVSVPGYVRNNWGEKPINTYLSGIRLSPQWYECNVEIP